MIHRYRNNKWWAMKPDTDGNYVPYHEYKQEIDAQEWAKQELRREIAGLEKDIKLYKAHANTWKNLYHHRRDMHVEAENIIAEIRKRQIRFNLVISTVFIVGIAVFTLYK